MIRMAWRYFDGAELREGASEWERAWKKKREELERVVAFANKHHGQDTHWIESSEDADNREGDQ